LPALSSEPTFPAFKMRVMLIITYLTMSGSLGL
jgi:hypothetical protein